MAERTIHCDDHTPSHFGTIDIHQVVSRRYQSLSVSMFDPFHPSLFWSEIIIAYVINEPNGRGSGQPSPRAMSRCYCLLVAVDVRYDRRLR